MASKKKALSKKELAAKAKREEERKKAEFIKTSNEIIQKFMGSKTRQSYHLSWNLLIPVVTKLIGEIDKVSLPGVPASLRGLKKLGWKRRVFMMLEDAVITNKSEKLIIVIATIIIALDYAKSYSKNKTVKNGNSNSKSSKKTR